MVKPMFTTDFLGAAIGEGADELTLRAHEEGVLRTFIDTTNVGNKRWRPPQVDEDRHAFCQAMSKESKDQSGKPYDINTRTCTSSYKQEFWREQEGQSALSLESNKR